MCYNVFETSTITNLSFEKNEIRTPLAFVCKGVASGKNNIYLINKVMRYKP